MRSGPGVAELTIRVTGKPVNLVNHGSPENDPVTVIERPHMDRRPGEREQQPEADTRGWKSREDSPPNYNLAFV